jgi:hypothetical protein
MSDTNPGGPGVMRYYCTTFLRPQRTFNALLGDKKHYAYGFLFMLIPVCGYTLMYVFLTIGNGAPSVFTPWLNIPKENYYAVNRFLLAPSMIISWFMAAAVVQVLSRWAKGTGTFEQTLALLGLSISVAMWGTLVHDLVMSFLSSVRVIDAREHEIAMNSPTIWRTLLWISMGIYLAAFLLLFSKTVKAVHKLSSGPAIIIGTAGFIVFQLMFVLFNR